MQDFAAIDFETANNERSSVCSVGIVIVRGGEIMDKFYSLIKPEPEYYNYWCSQVHGLCAEDTLTLTFFIKFWLPCSLGMNICVVVMNEQLLLGCMNSCCGDE